MSKVEERKIAYDFRQRSSLAAHSKRAAIGQLAASMSAASHRAVAEAARLLPEIWEARRRLDWGCLPVVIR